MTQECPDFHFSKSLTSTLGFSTQRLLGDEGVRPNRTHVDLVFHHVVELQYVHVADSRFLFKSLPSAPVVKLDLAVFIPTGFLQFFFYFFVSSASKWRHDRLVAESFGRKSEVKLQDLTQVHTARHTKWGKYDIYWSAVSAIRHVFYRQYF